MCDMIKITVMENQGDQRLDRFLKKYLVNAPLSHIYRLIRKDVKVNGRRSMPEAVIKAGDEITLYISAEQEAALKKRQKQVKVKKQFSVIYEDPNILIVSKPFGLLTHGDQREKKNHLANQVIGYLMEKGEYDPDRDTAFSPAPVNRLDRNTTGLVMFGKSSAALRELSSMIRERDEIEKSYLTITSGHIKDPLWLEGSMIKDRERNLITVLEKNDEGKLMESYVEPIIRTETGRPFTFAQVTIRTGRTHQIRAQLAEAGYPLIGDTKYGNRKVNDFVRSKYGLTTQLLHAFRLRFVRCRQDGPLSYLQGREFVCDLPERFLRIKKDIFG